MCDEPFLVILWVEVTSLKGIVSREGVGHPLMTMRPHLGWQDVVDGGLASKWSFFKLNCSYIHFLKDVGCTTS